MEDQELLDLINKSPIPVQEKERLVLKFKNNGITKNLLLQMKNSFLDVENGLKDKYQKTAKEIDLATQEFEKEMEEIEGEADEIYKKASEEIDAINLEEARSAIPE